MKKLTAIIISLITALFSLSAGAVDIYMVNVGKGDAILVMDNGKNWLIDTGKAAAWDDVKAALKRFGVKQLEGVFMTHTDKDHSGGLKKLAKSNIEVKAWYAAELCSADKADNPITEAAKKCDKDVIWLSAGDTVDGIFKVLGPLSSDSSNEDNNSLVLMLSTEYGKALLTGDMEIAEELELVESGAELACDVFKVPNHADNDVCMAGLIEETGASIALVSTDPYDKPGTPDEFLLSRLETLGMQVYRTDFTNNGILVRMDKNGITVTED